jgi:hypothetical protein
MGALLAHVAASVTNSSPDGIRRRRLAGQRKHANGETERTLELARTEYPDCRLAVRSDGRLIPDLAFFNHSADR